MASRTNADLFFVLLGDDSVGKTTLLFYFEREQFLAHPSATIGASLSAKTVNVGGTTTKIAIWDTAGLESYHSLLRAYYRRKDAALVIYDITSMKSFDVAKSWVKELHEVEGESDMVIALLGNKVDLGNKRMVDYKDAHAYAKENNLIFMECSGKNGHNVHNIFVEVAENVLLIKPSKQEKLNARVPLLTLEGEAVKWKWSKEKESNLVAPQQQEKFFIPSQDAIADAKRVDYIEACEKAVREKFHVDIRPVRLNYIGTPRSGKTSFRLRLLGIIVDILWYERTKGAYIQPSTGAAEDGGHVILQINSTDMSTISAEKWSAIPDLPEEASMLSQIFYQAVKDSSLATTKLSSDTSVDSKSVAEVLFSSIKSFFVREAAAVTAGSIDGTDSSSQMDEALSVIDDALKAKQWESIKFALDDLTLVINTDIGGQAEFLDLQASLVQGPSFNLLFSRLVDQLDNQFDQYYTNEKGENTTKESSIMTVEDALFQILASIACFSDSFSNKTAPEASAQDDDRSQSKVMLVCTHRDLVSEDVVKRTDRLLQEKIRNTEFFDKGIVEFAGENQLILAVNNMSGGEEEMKKIRKLLERVMGQSFTKIRIPVSWLLFSLKIRSLKVSTLSLMECERLAGKLRIPPKELQHALWFLHHRVGVLLYYPEVPALKDTVICQMQVVFSSTTNLIKNTFTFGRVGKQISEKFREKGQFSVLDMKKAVSEHTSELLPLESLVQLLKYLGILTTISAPLPGNSQLTYFMPCVLKSAQPNELRPSSRSRHDPASLMIRYDCGYVPLGVFPSMITNLVSSQRAYGWEMIEEGLKKNRVQFLVGEDFDIVTLMSHSQFFEIAITRQLEEFQVSTEALCFSIRSVVQSTLHKVTSRMNYNFSMGYKFGFECPLHPGRQHICVLPSESSKAMLCLQHPKAKKQPVPMKRQHKLWFTEETLSHTVEAMRHPLSFTPSSATPSISSLCLLKWRDRQGCEQKFRLVDKVSAKWRRFGEVLGLEYNQLDAFEQEMLRRGGVVECWKCVMEHWRRGDSAHHPPTWDGLYTLLEDAEFGQIAVQLKEARNNAIF